MSERVLEADLRGEGCILFLIQEPLMSDKPRYPGIRILSNGNRVDFGELTRADVLERGLSLVEAQRGALAAG